MRLSRRTVVAVLGGATALGVAGATTWADGGDESPTVDALVAGSLLELASTVPGATVEAHGSAAVRRLIVEGIRDPDAVALADPLLFDGVSDRATLFATNALVLTHAPETPVADALREDWRGTLERPDVRVGRTDPTLDPLGYRTVMALRLTARRREFDADAVLTESTVFPETDLLNAVEGGAVDSAVTYRNMAVQRDLPYQELPASVDFSDPAHADTYATVSYDIGDRTVRGAPIRYAATATTDAGDQWVEELVTGTERLRTAGFSVPESYPTREDVGDG